MNKQEKNAILFDYEEITRIAAFAVNRLYKEKDWNLLKEDLEDIQIETATKVYKSLASFDSSRAKFSTWVSTIARNTALSYREKYCKNGLLQTSLAQENLEGEEYDILEARKVLDTKSSDSAIISQESEGIIYDAIEAQGKEMSRYLHLIIDGYKNKDIAKQYGIEANNLGVKICRSRKQLAHDQQVSRLMDEFGLRYY